MQIVDFAMCVSSIVFISWYNSNIHTNDVPANPNDVNETIIMNFANNTEFKF